MLKRKKRKNIQESMKKSKKKKTLMK